MRIQHDIPAMSAYRNYSANVSALSKNLEKLSSGYKINRAGDDAAGLAISEKMRAQITGLETAQKNAKDGISLIQTAEGALTEVHDMLNRMYELAEQSANGTYADEVDREQLQKEIVSLRTEINRIADSSNFNGIKLLDGSLDSKSTAKADAIAAAEAAAAAVETAHGELATGAEKTGKDALSGKVLAASTSNDPANTTDGVGLKTILETDYKASGKPGFTVNFDGVKHAFKDVTSTTATVDDAASITVKINNQGIALSEKDIADAYKKVKGTDAKNGDVADGEVIAAAIAKKYEAADFEDGGTATVNSTTVNNKYKVTADGDKVIFEAKNNQTENPTRHWNVTLKGIASENLDEVKTSSFKTGAITQTGTGASKTAEVTIKYTDASGAEQSKDITFTTSDVSGSAPAGSAAALITAINGDSTLKTLFTASGDEDGIILTSKTDGADAPAVTSVDLKTAGDNSFGVAAGTATKAHEAYAVGTTGYLNYGTEITIQSGKANVDQLASTTLTLTAADVKDGSVIRLGDQKYVIAVGDDSAYKNQENAVYVEGLKSDDGAFLDKICTKLAEVAQNNETFTVSHQGTGGEIGLKQLEAVKDSTDMSTMEGLCSYIGLSSVDAEKTKANNEAAKAEAQAAADAAQKKADETMEGKALSLQIGDTSEDFNKMDVNVKDCHAAAMGIGEIDISTQKGASDAMNNIKSAINYVSDVRGDLGALQNRLDHTISNLSVMQENIQDAESTIRDVDVAKEMMEYTKNSILVQSAQAMLAQANQLPQGVLQLLG